MMYELAFTESALKEWKKLSHTLRAQFKNKLEERQHNPHVPSAALSGAKNVFKIKLRQAGYRLVYSVEDSTVTVAVITVGKRDRNEVYQLAFSRLRDVPEC